MKFDVKFWVAREWEEVEFDICSAFIFTLWKTYRELDFSCFGDETIEVVKKYVVDAMNKDIAEALSVPDLIEVSPLIEDACNPAP